MDNRSGQSSPGYHFNLTDWLGTKRMQTTSSGNQQETCMSYPSGDGLICTGGTDATEQHFTGKDRDVAAGPWRQKRPLQRRLLRTFLR